jgi:hypothetical protein
MFGTFRKRYGILAEEKFNEQMNEWWYRLTTVAGLPRQFTHTVLPPGTKIDIEDDLEDESAGDPEYGNEILIRLNGEPCYGWLAVWDPPAAAVSDSPRVSPTQSERGEAPPEEAMPSIAEPSSPPVSEPPREKRRTHPQGDRVAIALRAEFPPDGKVPPPGELPDSDLVARIRLRFSDTSKSGSRGIPSRQTVLRTAGRLQRK